MLIITKKQINELRFLFYQLFEIEDVCNEYVDIKKQLGKQRAIYNRIKKITNDTDMYSNIYNVFAGGLLDNYNSCVIKLKELGVEVI